MKAMILAAGRGERLRPLTDTCPKPLLYAGKKRLIEYHLKNLSQAGIREVVINVSYKAEEIMDALGTRQYDTKIIYSIEKPHALNTGGGIIRALPLLGDEPFIVINSDVWTDYLLLSLVHKAHSLAPYLAHLVLVPNPPYHLHGDFGLQQGLLSAQKPFYTFAGVGLYCPSFFTLSDAHEDECIALAKIITTAIAQRKVSGELYQGEWVDVGTEERLQFLRMKMLSMYVASSSC